VKIKKKEFIQVLEEYHLYKRRRRIVIEIKSAGKQLRESLKIKA